MNFSIETIPEFEKELKKLVKKYNSLKDDYKKLLTSLNENPTQGKHLGDGIYKIRLAITSKNKGKRGGARVITYLKILDKRLILLSIYNKGEINNITDKEIQELLKQIRQS